MLADKKRIDELETGDIFCNKEGDSFRVIINAGDMICIEQMTVTHQFFWWDVEQEKKRNPYLYLEIIKRIK